jgi:hypothetical protein
MNKQFTVEITEILQRSIIVSAQSLEEAVGIITEQYKNEEIILSAEDFIGHAINVI